MSENGRADSETLASIVRYAADAVISKTIDGTITSWNNGAERLYGFSQDEAIGRPVSILIPEESVADEEVILNRVRAGHTVEAYVTRRRKNGSDVDVSLIVAPILDDGGQIVGVSSIARDVQSIRDREGQLVARFGALLEAAPDALVVVDTDGLIQYANERTEALFGHDRSVLIGQPVELLIPDADREKHPALRSTFVDQPSARLMGAGLQLWAKRSDGSTIPVDIQLSPLTTDDETLTMAAVRDITDRLAVENELREAKEEAERANRAKSDFLSRMSHELRTPLTAILGFTELLQLSDVPEEQRAMFIERMYKAGQHLLVLINDVLDISRVESGTLTITISPDALAPVVAEVVELLGPQAERRGIAIDTVIGADCVVLADVVRLRQILMNLVSNAIKYNRDGGLVTITSTMDAGAVTLDVVDSGSGIKQDDVPRLFQPFERLGFTEGDVEGTGIGLALSRALAELMGGTLTVESEWGQGSRFSLRLPRADAAVGTHMPDGADAEPNEPHATVLYIEDNLSNTVLVQSALALRPHVRLLSAPLGKVGLEIARQQPCDLVLLDLHLPDLPGEEVLNALRADESTADIPIVVVSADVTPRTVSTMMKAGAFAFITKPLIIREFLQTVDEALASVDKAGSAQTH